MLSYSKKIQRVMLLYLPSLLAKKAHLFTILLSKNGFAKLTATKRQKQVTKSENPCILISKIQNTTDLTVEETYFNMKTRRVFLLFGWSQFGWVTVFIVKIKSLADSSCLRNDVITSSNQTNQKPTFAFKIWSLSKVRNFK